MSRQTQGSERETPPVEMVSHIGGKLFLPKHLTVRALQEQCYHIQTGLWLNDLKLFTL